MESNSGFIVIHRDIQKWRYWGCETAMALWLSILIHANWKDGWFMGEEIPRGSFATSMDKFAEELGISRKTLLKWLKRFEDDGQITRRGYNRYTVITVINYAKYQDIPDERLQQSTQQGLHQWLQPGLQQGLHNRTNKQGNKETKKQIVFVPPTLEEVEEYCRERMNTVDANKFVDFYSAKGWMVGRNKMKDWKAAVRTWEKNDEYTTKSPQKEKEYWTF